jgi:surface polysaccharide O-acyltransferase-like enzyme
MSFVLYASRYYFDPPEWDDGPMWFAVALLLFSIIWAFTPRTWAFDRFKGPLTRSRIAILIGLAAIGTFLVRLAFPIGTDVWNMQLCFFTQYVLLFIVGIVAYRNNWLASLQMKDAKFWLTVSIASIFAIMFPMMIAGGALDGEFDPYNGGLTWQAAALSLWEQIFGIGMCVWFLVWFRERHNTQGRLVKKISDNAFAVYVFHPPVLIALAVILSDYSAPGILKFPILLAATIVITFSLAEFVLRRTPLLKQVL